MSSNVILTSSGVLLDLENPEAGQVNIYDIAQSLSRLPRFCGHTDKFYSVAQHSVLVAEILESWNSPNVYEGLMHEVSEACGVSDIASPVKRLMGKVSKRKIKELEAKLCKIFEIKFPFPRDVHNADLVALVTEFDQLFSEGNELALQYFRGIEKFDTKIVPLSPKAAEQLFLDKFTELNNK